jgi:hypothetical protein
VSDTGGSGSDTPTSMFGAGARQIQDALDARRLADTLAEWTVHAELSDDDIELIRAQSTVWISTVDAAG